MEESNVPSNEAASDPETYPAPADVAQRSFSGDLLNAVHLDEALESALNFESGLSAEQEDLLGQLDNSLNISDNELQLESGVDDSQEDTAYQVEASKFVAANGGPPDTGVIAQVILISTSLGSIRRQFFSSRRAKQLLDCKGIPYFLIDANRDVSQGANLEDQSLLQEWTSRQLLASDDHENGKFMIPQVLIDGVAVGNEVALQDLEEDGDLDWLFVRAACPSCLAERDPAQLSCPHCGASFVQLIDDHFVQEQTVQRMVRGQLYYDGHVSSAPPPLTASYRDIAARGLGHETVETLTYETLFGETPPETSTVEVI